MPRADIDVKPGSFNITTPQDWNRLVKGVKELIAGWAGEKITPEDVSVFWEPKEADGDAPDIFVTIGFSAGEEIGFTPSFTQCQTLAFRIASWLQNRFPANFEEAAAWVIPQYDAGYHIERRP